MTSPKKTTFLRQALIGAASAAVAYFGVWMFRNRKLFTVNDVTTGDSLAYPELRAHVYHADPAQTLESAAAAISSLPGMRLVLSDADKALILAEAETAVGRFVDEIAIQALPLGPRHTRVVIRSQSRFGRGDLGENARHIRALQDAMDTVLTGG